MQTAITRAIEQLRHNFRANAFIADEDKRLIKVTLPFYSCVISIMPYTDKEKIKKMLRACIEKNNEMTRAESRKNQKKLF